MENKGQIKIAVIGGGISGLCMTKLLLLKGYDVTLFEAQHRLGGRIKGGAGCGQKIDLGAQWLHQVGDEENSLTAILKEHNEPYTIDEEILECIPAPAIFDDFITYIAQKTFAADQPLSLSIKEYSDDPLLESYMEASLIDMASSADRFSSIEYVKLIDSITPDDYQLVNRTMYEFISSYFSDIPRDRVLLGTPVISIRYAYNHAAIITAKGEEHVFNKVIISVPLSQLQQEKIQFIPALPPEKRAAFQEIGMGTGLKFFLFFKESILDAPSVNNKFAPYYLQKKMGSYFVVISLLMGRFADKYYKDPETYRQEILKEISTLANRDVTSLLEDAVFHDWGHEPFIEGTYSFPAPGEGNAREVAAAPVDNTIFFIGEAMNTELEYGFIHGAMDTALKLSREF